MILNYYVYADTLVGFSVTYPPEIVEYSVPIGFSVEFSADVMTQYRTKLLMVGSPFELSWDFGDGPIITNSLGTVTHTYTSVGNFTISTSVRAVYSSVATLQRRTIRTYQGKKICCTCHLILKCMNLPYSAARTVNVTSDELFRIDNKNFTRVQQPVSFQAVAVSSTEIPPQASYMWAVQDVRSSIRNIVSNQKTLNYSFPTAGDYIVSVTGSYMSTGSFSGSIIVNAQSRYNNDIINCCYYTQDTSAWILTVAICQSCRPALSVDLHLTYLYYL